jgi:hypothetical protein
MDVSYDREVLLFQYRYRATGFISAGMKVLALMYAYQQANRLAEEKVRLNQAVSYSVAH